MFPLLTVNGAAVSTEDDAYDVESIAIEFDHESGNTHACAACGHPIAQTTTGWIDDDGEQDCPASPDTPPTGHQAQPLPLSWCNSAAIQLEEEQDAVTVSISVGDPRGAFTFTMTRVPEDADSELAGCLLLHMPYPKQPFEHAPLQEIRPGTYLVGSAPSPLPRHLAHSNA